MTDTQDLRRSAPSTIRNREPIGEVLLPLLPPSGLVLEVASGAGEHSIFYARKTPHLQWQPTDSSPEARASIAAWIASEGLSNVRAPLMLDASAPQWPVEQADFLICINMLHISPWESTLGLMRGAGRVLPVGGRLFIYGPFRRAGVPTAESNEAFDASLKRSNLLWGLRQLEDVVSAAVAEGLGVERVAEMPANNLCVIFRKAETEQGAVS